MLAVIEPLERHPQALKTGPSSGHKIYEHHLQSTISVLVKSFLHRYSTYGESEIRLTVRIAWQPILGMERWSSTDHWTSHDIKCLFSWAASKLYYMQIINICAVRQAN